MGGCEGGEAAGQRAEEGAGEQGVPLVFTPTYDPGVDSTPSLGARLGTLNAGVVTALAATDNRLEALVQQVVGAEVAPGYPGLAPGYPGGPWGARATPGLPGVLGINFHEFPLISLDFH